jgi:hypothetical protein
MIFRKTGSHSFRIMPLAPKRWREKAAAEWPVKRSAAQPAARYCRRDCEASISVPPRFRIHREPDRPDHDADNTAATF